MSEKDNSNLISAAVNSNLIITEDNKKINTEVKRTIIIFLISLISLILIVGGIYYIYLQQDHILNSSNIYYMYTDECPNCQIVKQYMLDNNVEERLALLEINISKLNMNNALSLPYFNKATKECQLPLSSVGVPFLYSNGECFIGRIEVIDYLNKTINLI